MSATIVPGHQAHGLDGSLVAPDWPPLTREEVTGILQHYPGFAHEPRLLTMSPRPFSAASVVACGVERVFVKRHHISVRTVDGLQEEHRFMAHLLARGASVPQVVATGRGATALASGEWTYEVHRIPEGFDLYSEAVSWTPFRWTRHAWSAGKTMAGLHRASAGYDAPARGRPLVAGFTIFASTEPEGVLDDYVSKRPALRDYLRANDMGREALELLRPFHAELVPLLPELAPLWTHNDFHGSNLFWSDKGPNARATSVVDFGLCDRTTAVHDLAHAIERNFVEWLSLVRDPENPGAVTVHTDQLAALLAGYETVTRLSTAERRALAPMTALCHAEFALSETDYFLTSLHSPEKGAMACEGYLVAHARWFRNAGRSLIDFIRKWAAETARRDA